MDNKLVILDFCGTVVDYQTFNPFIEYVLEKSGKISYRGFFCYALKLIDSGLSKFGIALNLYKKKIVKYTKGISESFMEQCAFEYYEKKVSNHYIPETLELIDRLKNNGYCIIIVSAACNMYLKFFASDYSIDYIIANELLFENGESKGRLKRKDCIGKRKPQYLEEYMGNMKMNGEYWICITDSKTDIPIIRLCKKSFIISHNNHQNWVGPEMEEIIWH